jgi:uncharacterized protein YabE (DUF348 family)
VTDTNKDAVEAELVDAEAEANADAEVDAAAETEMDLVDEEAEAADLADNETEADAEAEATDLADEEAEAADLADEEAEAADLADKVPAVRRRHRRPRRALRYTTITAVLALVATGVAGVAAAHKQVTLDVDGRVTSISTFTHDVGGILAAEGVRVGPNDLLAPDASTPLTDGLEIVVRTARQINVMIDGELETIWTTAQSAHEALTMLAERDPNVALVAYRTSNRQNLGILLTEGAPITVAVDGTTHLFNGVPNDVTGVLRSLDIPVGPEDRVVVTPAATESGGVIIHVQRVVTSEIVTETEIPYETVETETDELYVGRSETTQAGVPGRHTIIEQVTTVDGVEESRVVISEEIIDPISELVNVGTGERPPAPPAVPSGVAQQIAADMMAAQYGWGGDQFSCLASLWDRESGWNVYASNSYSGAYGIPQACPGSKMSAFGDDWQTNPATQIAWGLSYIAGRYGTPCGAWSTFLSKGWY